MTRPTPTQGAQSEAARVPRVSEPIGPRYSTPTCRGCPAFYVKPWREPSGDGETMDSGEEQICLAKSTSKTISVYGSVAARTPDWCPAADSDARQASRDKDVTIADLERGLAEAREMFDACARARDAAGWAGHPADAIRGMDENITDLQAWLTEAEQRAATAERRGFEAGRDAAGNEADRWAAEIDPSVAKVAALSIAKAIRALMSPAAQEGDRHATV